MKTPGTTRHPRARRWAALALWAVVVPTLAACVTLTVLRCIDPRQSRLIELAALAPLSVPLAFVASVSAGLLVALRTNVGVRAATWALAGGALILGLHLTWLAPFYTGQSPYPGTGSQFVVLAQNLEYGDPKALAEVSETTGADVVVLSDLPPNQVEALRQTNLLDRYPYRVGWSPDGADGTVIMSKYPLSDMARISDSSRSRLVRLQIPNMGSVDLVAVHPQPPYHADTWTQDYAQIEAFLDQTYGISTKTAVVVVGDFNGTQDNAPFRRILNLGFLDAVDLVNGGYQPTWPASGVRRLLGIRLPPLVQIDHALVSDGLVVTALSTVQIPGSDHSGVAVRLAKR